ncbi:MAG: type II toxin-antitoxin system Phd/YefM family antitoxin [Candidatus Omnitrophota bacterium]|nr:type II toxin-antitoxin system Phd/YefM family antitoxin [Candidatus Omnitrophota bacterium]
MTKNISLKDLRPRLPEIMAEVDSKMDRFVITKRGRPVALLMSIDDYESILESLDILSNTHLMKRLKKANEDLKAGRVVALDVIERELGIV